jgi:hypothetical protein
MALISDLFDSTKPCPPEIPNCEAMRAKYNEEVARLDPKACKPCVMSSIKNKYINLINSQR